MTSIVTNPSQIAQISSVSGFKFTKENDLSADDEAALKKLFAVFHSKIVCPEQSSSKFDIDEELDANHCASMIDELVEKESWLLFQCIQKLAMGDVDLDDDSTRMKRMKTQCYVSMENIVRATNDKGSKLRAVMGRVASQASTNIQQLLTKLGIAHTRTKVSDESNKQVIIHSDFTNATSFRMPSGKNPFEFADGMRS